MPVTRKPLVQSSRDPRGPPRPVQASCRPSTSRQSEHIAPRQPRMHRRFQPKHRVCPQHVGDAAFGIRIEMLVVVVGMGVAGAGQRAVVKGEIDRAIRGGCGESEKQNDQHGKAKRLQHPEYPCPIATGRRFQGGLPRLALYARLPCSTVSLAFFGARAISHSRALSRGIGKAME